MSEEKEIYPLLSLDYILFIYLQYFVINIILILLI